ncbi:MAG: cytochrome b N-terminal domain-containing protein [Myxococcales bacterium]|nr:cytochrome b N-terminal domain-containing protein [Myxococcota bacterium]MDW8284177.1 cytochrome b N-terminal domain-containing protein [Myxococcales bacterium]
MARGWTRRWLDWLESRTGYRALVHAALEERIRGGASPAYVFGSVLTFILLNQIVTGILLAAYYAPSATTAWASVAYIQDQVWLGWFVRGMHSAGASMMVLTLLLHLVQVTVYGAYRAPREVNWLTGLLLAAVVMAFALTGYLLPWDQKGYWATQVATTLLGATPLVGRTLQTLVQGGPVYGNLTLTHFFALHVFVLPATLILLLVVHIALFRRHGVTPKWGRSDEELERTADTFWPRQLFYDLVAMGVMLAFMVAWVIKTHGAELGAPADPASAFDARPEWYFLPLYQLLKYFPGALEVVAALGAPLIAGGVLVALPFLDRAATTHPRARRLPLALVLGGLAGATGLGLMAKVEDARNETYQKNVQAAHQEAQRARALALQGVLPQGGTAVYLNDPLEGGRLLFKEHCAGCHRLGPLGPVADKDVRGPDLTRFASRSWLEAFLRDPNSPAFFGRTRVKGMKPVQATEEELRALVEWAYSLSDPPDVDRSLAARGRQLFEEKDCDLCHELDGQTEGEGPMLPGLATRGWLVRLLKEPASPLFFGDKSEMPSFANKLTERELEQVAAFVAAQRDAK